MEPPVLVLLMLMIDCPHSHRQPWIFRLAFVVVSSAEDAVDVGLEDFATYRIGPAFYRASYHFSNSTILVHIKTLPLEEKENLN
jgi:hypothetical protein